MGGKIILRKIILKNRSMHATCAKQSVQTLSYELDAIISSTRIANYARQHFLNERNTWNNFKVLFPLS